MLRREDPEFVPPNPENSRLQLNGASSSNAEKRGREDDEDMADGTRQLKREKAGGDEDGEEMDMEDDDDSPDKKQGTSGREMLSDKVVNMLCSQLWRNCLLRGCYVRIFLKKLQTIY